MYEVNMKINKPSKMKELEISRGRRKKSMPSSYYDGETESIRDHIKFVKVTYFKYQSVTVPMTITVIGTGISIFTDLHNCS